MADPIAVAVDTETMGLDARRDRLCLVQLSAGDGVSHLVQFAKGRVSRAPQARVWSIAHSQPWLLRIDDLDLARNVAGAADEIKRALDAHGLHWDGSPILQSERSERYQHALHSLDYEQVHEVRVGKLLYLDVEAASSEEAREGVEAMCRRLLANPVTEDFEIDVREATEKTVPA